MATIRELMDSLPAGFDPEAAEGVRAVFRIIVTGNQSGTWHVIVEDDKCRVREGGDDNPNVTFTIAEKDCVEMLTGALSGHEAFFTGRLLVTGDLLLAQKFDNLFKYLPDRKGHEGP